jgi:hypothetical protein
MIYFAIQSTFKMSQEKDYLKDITEIRTMMERSSRFISLSGLSGVFAGVVALIGAGVAYLYLGEKISVPYSGNPYYYELVQYASPKDISVLVLIGALILFFAVLGGYYFTARKAKRQGTKTWDKTARRMVGSMAIPLAIGGIFCLALFYHGQIGLIAPATLVFYGLALLSGGQYTFKDIRYLGYLQLLLGCISAFYVGYGLIFWSVGFGILHIVYGIVMYFKYDQTA